jgi:hypothetical protein
MPSPETLPNLHVRVIGGSSAGHRPSTHLGHIRGEDERSARPSHFSLPTLTSVNPIFDESTPTGPNWRPRVSRRDRPHRPRDGLERIRDLMECLSF